MWKTEGKRVFIKDWEEFLMTERESFLVRYKTIKLHSQVTEFSLRQTLGVGGFGRVILVLHIPTQEFYAAKVFEKSLIVQSRLYNRTKNEKAVLSAVRFHFVVHLVTFCQDSTYLYMILPFCGGGDIFTLLRKMKKFPEKLSNQYGAQVLLALEYLHHVGLIYRDLKPENLMLDHQGYIKLTDLGFCKILNGRTYTMCGTPEYLAPEILLNKGYGKAVDWWAFGVLLFETTAGYPPFFNEQKVRMYEMITEGKLKIPKSFSPELKDLVSKLITLDTSKRFGNLARGAGDIKDHAWFRNLNWMEITNQDFVPLIVPIISGPGDVRNFSISAKGGSKVMLKAQEFDMYRTEFLDF